MNLPFSAEQFFQVFSEYNQTIGVAPMLLMVPALVSVLALRRPNPDTLRIVASSLAALWIWSGVVYHALFFARINPVALAFGGLFVVQGWWFYRFGRDGGSGVVAVPSRIQAAIGGVMVGYALVGYPVVSILLGHSWPAVPTFGVPCPLVIFTLGTWVWLGLPGPRRLLIIPLAWSGLGFTAAWTFGVYEDLGLLVAGVVTLGLLASRPVRHREVRMGSHETQPAPFGVRPAR